MTKRRLNPRAAAVYKALYGKEHPDKQKHKIPLPRAIFELRMKELAEAFREAGVTAEHLAKSLEHLAATLRNEEQARIRQRAFADLEAMVLGEMRIGVDYGASPQGLIDRFYSSRRRIPQIQTQQLSEANRAQFLESPYLDDLRFIDVDSPRYEIDMSSMHTREIIASVRLPIPTREDHVRTFNHPRGEAQNRPVHPGANIRGFRRDR